MYILILRVVVAKILSVASSLHCMHVDNELVESMTIGEQEYEEVIEEYEEEILM